MSTTLLNQEHHERFDRLQLVALGWLMIIGTMFVAILLALGLIRVDRVVTAEGRVVSRSATLVLQPLEASIVRSIDVHEGQTVQAGQVLARLDPTFAAADVGALAAQVSTLQAVAGLWSTGADLVRLGLGWSSLLPAALAREALTPQTGPGPGGTRVGLGWLLSPGGDTAIHSGGGVEGTALLTVRRRDDRAQVVLTSRLIPVTSLAGRLHQHAA